MIVYRVAAIWNINMNINMNIEYFLNVQFIHIRIFFEILGNT